MLKIPYILILIFIIFVSRLYVKIIPNLNCVYYYSLFYYLFNLLFFYFTDFMLNPYFQFVYDCFSFRPRASCVCSVCERFEPQTQSPFKIKAQLCVADHLRSDSETLSPVPTRRGSVVTAPSTLYSSILLFFYSFILLFLQVKVNRRTTSFKYSESNMAAIYKQGGNIYTTRRILSIYINIYLCVVYIYILKYILVYSIYVYIHKYIQVNSIIYITIITLSIYINKNP